MIKKLYNIFYVKTPKCASTSLQAALKCYCDANGLKWVGKAEPQILQQKEKINASLGHVPYLEKNLNHIKSLMCGPDRLMLGNVSFQVAGHELVSICSVRHPLFRLRSQFIYTGITQTTEGLERLYLEKNGEPSAHMIPRNYGRQFLNGVPKWNFSRVNNELSRYLGFQHLQDISAASLKSRFFHIQIAEKWQEGLRSLSNKLDYPLPDLWQNRTKYKKEEFSPELKDLHRKKNPLDYKLYETCLKIA